MTKFKSAFEPIGLDLSGWRSSSVFRSPAGRGGYSHTKPIQVCASQSMGSRFGAFDLEWGIIYFEVFLCKFVGLVNNFTFFL